MPSVTFTQGETDSGSEMPLDTAYGREMNTHE